MPLEGCASNVGVYMDLFHVPETVVPPSFTEEAAPADDFVDELISTDFPFKEAPVALEEPGSKVGV